MRVRVETGQPVVWVTAAGSQRFGDPLNTEDIFDAIACALPPEKQAELALSERTRWMMTGDVAWEVEVRAGADGVAVEARREDAQASVWHGHTPEAPVAVPEQELDFELDVDVELDLGAQPAGVAVPELELEFELQRGRDDDEVPHVPQEGDWIELDDPHPADVEGAKRGREQSAAPLTHRVDVEANTSVVGQQLEGVGVGVPAGAICFASPQLLPDVVGALGAAALSVGDDARSGLEEEQATVARLRQLNEGSGEGCIVVRAEDPSRWLAWVLRRLEEGHRVVVETRALSPAGALRCLLGTAATVRAHAWLDEHPHFSARVEDGRLQLVEIKQDSAHAGA